MAGEGTKNVVRQRNSSPRQDGAVAEVAARQHGLVTREQLRELGLGEGAIDDRLRRGVLHPVYRRIFTVGHPGLTREGRWLAAVLACGRGTALSHGAAAAHWRLLPAPLTPPEVTTPHRRQHPGVRSHRRRLPPDEVTVHLGIPAPTVPRTILDVAADGGRRVAERALREAEARRATDPLSLGDLVARYPRRRGVAVVRAILADRERGSGISRSELESRFLEFLDGVGLPRPAVNLWLRVGEEWLECDCVWRRQRVIVELDSRAFHMLPEAFERDRVRDRLLQGAGWRVVRVTWRQLHDAPHALAADLRTLLDQGPRRGDE